MKQLSEIWLDLSNAGYTTDKNTVHSYIDVYSKILEPYRGADKTVLEIGLFEGNSLRMWERYFNGDVYGIDCSETPHGGMADLRPMIATGMFNIFICDAENPADIEKYFKKKRFDVVLEDAAHHIEQQLQIYKTIKPYLNPGAIYCIEDIQHIDETRTVFENIDSDKNVEIIDRRNILGRYDDVLCIITDKK